MVCANLLGISSNLGSLFENQLYLDLRRQGKTVYYYYTKEGYEIDFVVKNPDGSLELIQAVWDMSDSKTLGREQRAVAAAEEELGIKGRIIDLNPTSPLVVPEFHYLTNPKRLAIFEMD